MSLKFGMKSKPYRKPYLTLKSTMADRYINNFIEFAELYCIRTPNQVDLFASTSKLMKPRRLCAPYMTDTVL